MITKIEDKYFSDLGLKGWVEIDMPNPMERMSLSTQVSMDGDDLASTLKQAEALVKISVERIKALSIEHESGIKFSSLEEMYSFDICNSLLYTIGGIILNGIPLGKSLKNK